MTPPRFACDVMLGKTARWLRMLGCDTFYDNRAEDAQLKKLCLLENRILLTKDVGLHRLMPAGTSRLVEAARPRLQLQEIVICFHLHQVALPPRCSLCNGELAMVEKNFLKDRIPPYVFLTQNNFQRCGQCRKIYWPGSHMEKIRFFLDQLKKRP